MPASGGKGSVTRRDRLAGATNDSARFIALYRQGTDALLDGRPHEAIAPLEAALAIDPDHVDAALNLGGAYILARRFRKARALLKRLSRLAPENTAVWQNLGAAYLGNPVLADRDARVRAAAAFERALALDPAAHRVAYNIGLVYRDLGDFRKAAGWFARALDTDPGDEHARAQLRRVQRNLAPKGGDREEDILEEE